MQFEITGKDSAVLKRSDGILFGWRIGEARATDGYFAVRAG